MDAFSVIQLPVGQMRSNAYLFFNKDREAVIIDPGDDAEYISDKVLENDLTPLAIISTHGHFDHVAGALTLQLAFNIPFYLGEKDASFLTDMRTTTIHFTNIDPGPPPQATLVPHETKELIVGNISFKLIEVPGHTPGSLSLYSKEAECVFVGDIVFSDGSTGEWRHKYGNRKTLLHSIEKIMKLPEDTKVYTGHGEDTTVKELSKFF